MGLQLSHQGDSQDNVGRVVEEYFVRNGGSDDNSGTTELTAFATLEKALSKLVEDYEGKMRQRINLTGFSGSGVDILYRSLPPSSRRPEQVLTGRDVTEAKQDRWDMPFELYADPLLVRNITITDSTLDATTGMPTLTVSDTLAVNELQGMVIWQSFTEQAVVQSNTANTITVASYHGNFDNGTVGVYTQSCTLDFGNISVNAIGLMVTTNACTVFSGIRFTAADDSSMGVECNADTWFNWCRWDKGLFVQSSTKKLTMLDCYMNSGSLLLDSPHDFQGCVFQGVTVTKNGSVGKDEISWCIFDSCSAIGSGNYEQLSTLSLANTHIDNSTGNGVLIESPFNVSITNCRIDNSTSSAVAVECGGGTVLVSGLVGTGNARFGMELSQGARVDYDDGTAVNTVTGTRGEVQVGDLPPQLWTRMPMSDVKADTPQGCSVISGPSTSTVVAPNLKRGTNVREQIIYYARPGGDDNNGGTNTTTDAVASWERLMELVDRDPPRGVHQVLDGTGVDWTEADFRTLPEVFAGAGSNLDFLGAGGGVQNIYDLPLEFRAEPEAVLTVTLNGAVTTSANGNTRTMTVNETLTPDAHVGEFLVGSGLVQWGAIISNTANTITYCSDNTTWTGNTAQIMTQSSTWTFGDAGNFFEGPLWYTAQCSTAFNGINFTSVQATWGPNFTPLYPMNFLFCKFPTSVSFSGAAALIICEVCDFQNNYAQNGAPVSVRSSTFRGITWNTHGEGGNGLTGFQNCDFNGCQPLGTGNAESNLNYSVKDSRIHNSPGVGMIVPSSLRCVASNVYFENVTGDCIVSARGGIITASNCASDALTCTGWGVTLSNGAQCERSGGTVLEGTLGELRIGALATSTAWTALPATDAGEAIPQFCRAY